MYETTYLRAASLDEAVGWLREHEEARPLSGGMTLIPTLKQRLAAPSHLVDLTRIDALRGIEVRGGVLRIGALTKHAEVAASTIVRGAIPALAYLAGVIADPQVRNRGTLGGSVANNDPAADYPAAVLGLNAHVLTSSQRRIAADEFSSTRSRPRSARTNSSPRSSSRSRRGRPMRSTGIRRPATRWPAYSSPSTTMRSASR